MATYEFKSLSHMADWFAKQADIASSAAARATTQRDNKLLMREASTYVSVAHMIRNSVIKFDPPGFDVSTLGTVTEPFNAKKLADNHEALLKIASNSYFGTDRNDIVAAIKAIRNATGLGLREAKDWCDSYREQFK